MGTANGTPSGTANGIPPGTANGTPRDLLDALLTLLLALVALARRLARAGPLPRASAEPCCDGLTAALVMVLERVPVERARAAAARASYFANYQLGQVRRILREVRGGRSPSRCAFASD